jgi:succinate dehydrogenase/fumarate reductase flavoprotein subunit
MTERSSTQSSASQRQPLREDKMAKQQEAPKKVSRRELVRGAAVGAAGVAAGALAGCAPSATPAPAPTPEVIEKEVVKEVKPWLPEKWDYEADVVILGTGFAGQATAIEADKAGVSVLMLEKAPEKHQGGNSRVCGQGFLSPSPAIIEAYVDYITAMTEGVGMPAPEGWARFYTEESSKNIAWFESLGAEILPTSGTAEPGTWIPFYPHFPGAEAIATEPGYYKVGGKYAGPGSNWYFLEDYILSRPGIEKMFETPAKRLIQDPVTKEVLGVVAEREGKEVFVKARRAVVVCAGGFEYNQQMKRDFQGPPVPSYTYGSPYNTGETIKMCWAAGADIRAMSSFSSPCRYSAGMKGDLLAALRAEPMVKKGGMIMVGANNKRWFDEYRPRMGGMQYLGVSHLEGACADTGTVIENGVFVKMKFPMPMHMIFNEEARLAGRSLFAGSAWMEQVEGYKFSDDNSEEVEKGWIVRASSIRELASKIGRDPDALEATVRRWNESCEAGKDLEFDKGDPEFVPYYRPKELLNPIPLEGEPVYALELFPVNLNTQGGMVRNTKSQVLDIYGNPIPRLYSAGENGDIWTWLYQCMSNVGGGCYAFGRVAGQNAANEEPWS